jgi:hypothetical protein
MTSEVAHLRKLQRLGDHRLKLWFTDGQSGEWDFSSIKTRSGDMAAPLRDPAYFDRVFLEMGALTWPNGYDWSPQALYDDMVAAGALKIETAAA